MTHFSLSIVVPVYRSEQSLRELIRRISAVADDWPADVEILLVEDDGGDACWEIIVETALLDRRVRGFRHSRNFGQQNALLTGIREARHQVIVTLDDDLQNPPEEIPKLVAALDRSYDVIYGTSTRVTHGFGRDLTSALVKLALQGVLGAETARKASSFRAFRADLRRAFEDYKNPTVLIDVLLTWATTRIGAIPVDHHERALGPSNYNLRKLFVHAMNLTTGFSVLPLKIASFVGFLLTLIGFCLLMYVLGSYFVRGTTVAGFPFLASMIALFSGAQMFALGIFGEYLARIHLRSMGKPLAVLREQTHSGVPEQWPQLKGVPDGISRFRPTGPDGLQDIGARGPDK